IITEFAHLVIERHPVLFASLLYRPETFQLGFEPDDLLLQSVEARHLLVELALFALQLAGELARFALHGERSGTRLLAARDRVAVIADAVRQQEIEMRIAHGEALRG